MGLSLGVGLGLTFGQSLSWAPSSVASVTAFWDISVLSTLFSDRSATPGTPAVVDGVVGTIKDLGPTGAHLIAPADAARGILRTDGAGKYWIETDGIDDRYVTSQPLSSMVSASAFEVVFAGRAITVADSRRFLDSGAGYWTQPILRTGPTVLFARSDVGGSNKDVPSGGAAYTANTNFVWSSRLASGTQYGRLDNGTEGSIVCGPLNSVSNPVGIMANSVGGGGNINGRFYAAAICNAAVTAAERLNMRTWAGAKNGVSITA